LKTNFKDSKIERAVSDLFLSSLARKAGTIKIQDARISDWGSLNAAWMIMLALSVGCSIPRSRRAEHLRDASWF